MVPSSSSATSNLVGVELAGVLTADRFLAFVVELAGRFRFLDFDGASESSETTKSSMSSVGIISYEHDV